MRAMSSSASTASVVSRASHRSSSGRSCSPVRIDYLSGTGATTSRVVEEVELDRGAIDAWCRLRNGQRRFSLDGILAVAPA